MKPTDNPLQSLLDIEPPPPPPDHGAAVLTATGVVLIGVVALYLLWHRLWSRRARARRELRRQRALVRRGHLDGRGAAYDIAATLRAGLGLSHVGPATRLPARLESQRNRWRHFVETLYRARYSPAPCTPQEQERLFADAELWLRRWP